MVEKGEVWMFLIWYRGKRVRKGGGGVGWGGGGDRKLNRHGDQRENPGNVCWGALRGLW